RARVSVAQRLCAGPRPYQLVVRQAPHGQRGDRVVGPAVDRQQRANFERGHLVSLWRPGYQRAVACEPPSQPPRSMRLAPCTKSISKALPTRIVTPAAISSSWLSSLLLNGRPRKRSLVCCNTTTGSTSAAKVLVPMPRAAVTTAGRTQLRNTRCFFAAVGPADATRARLTLRGVVEKGARSGFAPDTSSLKLASLELSGISFRKPTHRPLAGLCAHAESMAVCCDRIGLRAFRS